MTIKQVIDYEQCYYSPIRGEGEPPRNYYDPNVMLAEKTYKLNPMEEILIVISGSGYRYNDDTVYSLNIYGKNEQMNETVNTLLEYNINPVINSSSQLCLLVKNCSAEYSVYVGYKSPLQWLLDMPRLISKLCYCSTADLTKCRLVFSNIDKCKKVYNSNDDPDTTECLSMFQSAPNETIVIGI